VSGRLYIALIKASNHLSNEIGRRGLQRVAELKHRAKAR